MPPILITAAPLQVMVPPVMLPVTPRVPVDMVIVPPLVSVATEFTVAARSSVPPEVVVKVPLTVRLPTAVSVRLVLRNVKLLYVPAGQDCPPARTAN